MACRAKVNFNHRKEMKSSSCRLFSVSCWFNVAFLRLLQRFCSNTQSSWELQILDRLSRREEMSFTALPMSACLSCSCLSGGRLRRNATDKTNSASICASSPLVATARAPVSSSEISLSSFIIHSRRSRAFSHEVARHHHRVSLRCWSSRTWWETFLVV